MNPAERFATLQQSAQQTAQAVRTNRIDLECRYQAIAYAPAGKRKAHERLQRAESRAWEKFYSFLCKISPRPWDQGVPCNWVRDSLTYSDAVTTGQLSAIPPPAWGYTDQFGREFSRPIKTEAA